MRRKHVVCKEMLVQGQRIHWFLKNLVGLTHYWMIHGQDMDNCWVGRMFQGSSSNHGGSMDNLGSSGPLSEDVQTVYGC